MLPHLPKPCLPGFSQRCSAGPAGLQPIHGLLGSKKPLFLLPQGILPLRFLLQPMAAGGFRLSGVLQRFLLPAVPLGLCPQSLQPGTEALQTFCRLPLTLVRLGLLCLFSLQQTLLFLQPALRLLQCGQHGIFIPHVFRLSLHLHDFPGKSFRLPGDALYTLLCVPLLPGVLPKLLLLPAQTPALLLQGSHSVFQPLSGLPCRRQSAKLLSGLFQRRLKTVPALCQLLFLSSGLLYLLQNAAVLPALLLQPLKLLQIPPAFLDLLHQLRTLPVLLPGLFKSLPGLTELFLQRLPQPPVLLQRLLLLSCPADISDQLVCSLYLPVKPCYLLFHLPQALLILPAQRLQQRKPLAHPAVEPALLEFLQLKPRLGYLPCLPALDIVHILTNALLQILIFVPLLPNLLLQPLLKSLIQPRIKYLPENIAAGFRVRKQKLLEIPLRYHGDLGELLSVQTQKLRHGSGHFLHLRHGRPPVRVDQLRLRPLKGISASPPLRALVFRVPPHRIPFPAVFKQIFHIGRGILTGVFAAEHIRPAHIAAGFPV